MSRARTVSFFLPDLVGGGAERATLELAEATRTAGDLVEILVARPGGSASATAPNDISVRVLGSGRTGAAMPALSSPPTPGEPRRACLGAHPREHRCSRRAQDSTHTHEGHRCRAREHAYVVGAMGQRRAAAYTLAVRAAYGGADAIVAVSEGTALALAQEIRLPLHDITVVPNIVHVDKIRAASESPLPFHVHDVPLVVAVGRLTPVKGFDVLIRAFSEVRDKMQAQLVIAGEGEERTALLELVRALGSLRGHSVTRLPRESLCLDGTRECGRAFLVLGGTPDGFARSVRSRCAGSRDGLPDRSWRTAQRLVRPPCPRR